MNPKSALVFFFVFAIARVSAQINLIDGPGTGYKGGFPGGNNLGYEFTVGMTPLNVTALGFWGAGSALYTDHQIGLWDTSGGLLATVLLPMGASRAPGSSFVFQALASPVLLSANTNYVLTALYPDFADGYSYNIYPGEHPTMTGATLVGTRTGTPSPSATFYFPPTVVTNGAMWVGPNMTFTPVTAVPEPSTYAVGAITLASLVVGLKIRRRRR